MGQTEVIEYLKEAYKEGDGWVSPSELRASMNMSKNVSGRIIGQLYRYGFIEVKAVSLRERKIRLLTKYL